jgi:hypothetical protein
MDNPQNSDNYYLKRITQTDFRGGKEKGVVKEDSHQYIDLSLSPIKASPEVKEALKKIIEIEASSIVDTLLPPKKAVHIKASDYLNEINTRLGL